jgi:hypothetical protein
LWLTSLWLLAGVASAQQAPERVDLESLKAQVDALKAEYDKKIQELQSQIEQLQIQALQTETTTVSGPAQPAAAPQTLGALNPAISVVGNFLARADNRKTFLEDGNRIDNTLNLREAEIDMRVPVDPYADAVLITSLESERPGHFSADVEEGYVNIKRLPFVSTMPLGMKFQVGRFRPSFGKFNVLHTHDLPTSFRSLPTEEFLGEEGFIQQGLSTNFYIPTPWDENESIDATFQFLGGGDLAAAPESGNRKAYLGHLRWFRTFADTHNTELGWSTYYHPGRGEVSTSRLHAVDFMYRWKPFRQGQWKSYLLGGELMLADPVDSRRPYGYTAFTQWQLDRRKYVGVRWDTTKTLADPSLQRRSITPYLSYYFSEFLRFRLNFERRWSSLTSEERRSSVFLELNWVFGSHPPEPFWVNK